MGQKAQFVEKVCVGHHLCKGEWKQRELTLAPGKRLVYLVAQSEGAAASSYHLHAGHLVSDELHAESNVGNALCLVNDDNAICCKEGAQACGGDALKELLRVWVIAVQPQNVVLSRQHLAKKCGLAHLTGSHDDNGLLRVKQRRNGLFNGSVYHRKAYLRCKGNQKAEEIQKSYNNFGIKSKNLISFLDSSPNK